jgi:hypothetical protein
LVFNDSIYIPYAEIEYLVLKDINNAGWSFFGLLTLATTGFAIALAPEVATYGIVGFGASMLYFSMVNKDKIYTKDWYLNIQHIPEILYPKDRYFNYQYWPSLIERYEK